MSGRWIFACFLVGCGGLLSQSSDAPDGGRRDGAIVDGEEPEHCSGTCIDAPHGWKHVGYGNPGSCPGGWRVMLIIENPTADPPICWCSCGLKIDQHCTTSSVLLEASTDPGCGNAQTTNLPHQGCAPSSFDYAPNAPIYVRGTGTSTLPSGGGCAGTPNLVLPPAHATPAVMCEWPSAAGTCREGRDCRVPRDPSVAECIMRDGENDCPGGFPKRRLAGDEIADSRSCTSCDCVFGSPGKCKTYVTTTATGNCTGPDSVLEADGACRKYPNAQLHIGSQTMYSVVEGATCVPRKGASEPIGTVDLWHPHTICCR